MSSLNTKSPIKSIFSACSVSSGSLIYWSMRGNIRKLLFVNDGVGWSHSWGSSGSPRLKKVSHLAREIRSAQSKSSTLITHVQHSAAHSQWTLCNPIFITSPFPPCQVGLSILPSRIKFPLSPRSQLLSDHRSCALLISISCRFHFPRQRVREIKRRWVRRGTNALTQHHRGVAIYYYLRPCCTDRRKDSAHELVHTHHLWVLNLQNRFLY